MNLSTGGWASPLLRLVARLRSESPNSTTPVTEINGGTISATNADIAIVAKGTGATLAQVPDGTTAGGNKRGLRATDLQKLRSVATMVASGNQSVICGGYDNTASNFQSVCVGGGVNNASGNLSSILGGTTNTASGEYGVAVGGLSNTASSASSFVGGGQSNTAQTNTHATVCGGNSNTASGQESFIGSGNGNVASGFRSVICGGLQNTNSSGSSGFIGAGYLNTNDSSFGFIGGGVRGTTRGIVGYHVFPACNSPVFNGLGVTQSALLLLGRQTTNDTPTVLTSNTSTAGTANQVILPNNSAYSFSGEVIAGVTAAGDTARWTINGAIKRGANAASTAMVGTPTVTMTHNDAGAAAWTVAVTADTTNGGISVTVTGAAATTIRWLCRINTVEVTY